MGTPEEPEQPAQIGVTDDGEPIHELDDWERDPEVPESFNREEVGEGHR